MITDKLENIRFQIRDDFSKIFVTQEMFNARFNMLENKFDEKFKTVDEKFKVVDERFNMIDEKFNMMDERFKNLNFRLTILIALVILALTFANPAFVRLLEKLIF